MTTLINKMMECLPLPSSTTGTIKAEAETAVPKSPAVTRIILLYGFDPTPDLDENDNTDLVMPVKEGATQFLKQYADAMQRQDSKTNPLDRI